jgi:hypothetical protein
MKYTNFLNLPEPLVNAVVNDDYDRGSSDITVTELLSPPRKVALEKMHSDELVTDVSESMWALIGQAVHSILERSGTTGRTEERMYAEVLGWKVGGKFDHYFQRKNKWVLQDWKIVSAWEGLNGPKPERAMQLNLLAYLLRTNGEPVDEVEIVYIFRDWSKRDSMNNDSYPKQQVMVYSMELMEYEAQLDMMRKLVSEHQQAQGTVLPLCSAEDRWEKPEKWAVMKDGRKSALRLLDSEADAVRWAEENAKGKYDLVRRPGESTRCLMYCYAAPFCDQWAEIQSAGRGADLTSA